jgi:hypothetical protein
MEAAAARRRQRLGQAEAAASRRRWLLGQVEAAASRRRRWLGLAEAKKKLALINILEERNWMPVLTCGGVHI